jgi:hypothetical protein
VQKLARAVLLNVRNTTTNTVNVVLHLAVVVPSLADKWQQQWHNPRFYVFERVKIIESERHANYFDIGFIHSGVPTLSSLINKLLINYK